MPMRWPRMHSYHHDGDVTADQELAVHRSLDAFADHVEAGLTALGLSPAVSLLWQPWHLAVIWDEQSTWCVFTPNTGGTPELHYFARPGVRLVDPGNVAAIVTRDMYWNPVEVIRLPLPGTANAVSEIAVEARRYVELMERNAMLSRLGDIQGLEHLEPHLRAFLEDHPDPTRNVFVMMRFHPSPQLTEVYGTIEKTLEARNMTAIRVDARDYSSDLWTNIEVCITGCQYGIAVFEDIDQRDFNPNVALEVGYMLARRKRVLILKEKRLPNVPSDIAGKLYKPWDSYEIQETVSEQVAQWVDVDLKLTS